MKKSMLYRLIIPVFFLFVAQSCILVVDDDPIAPRPDCDIVSLTKVNGDATTYSKFRIKIANISPDSKAFQVHCSIKMKIGSTIVDRTSEEFGDLYYRESVMGDVYIYNLYDHTDYDYAEITLSWEDEFGNVYDKVYRY